MAVIVDESVLSSLSEATEMLAYQLMMKEEEDNSHHNHAYTQLFTHELNHHSSSSAKLSRRLDSFS